MAQAPRHTLQTRHRDDSGFGPPSFWAKDTLDRKVTVVGGPNYFVEVEGNVGPYDASASRTVIDLEITQCDLVLEVGLL